MSRLSWYRLKPNSLSDRIDFKASSEVSRRMRHNEHDGTQPEHLEGPPVSRIGEKVAFALLLVTSVHLAILQPYVTLLSDSRVNLFSGLVCLAALIAAVIFGRKDGLHWKSPEILFSIGMAGLMVLSAWTSETTNSAALRALVVGASGLGGYWSARLLVRDDRRRRILVWCAWILFAVVVALAALGLALNGQVHRFLDSHWHPAGGRIILLAFAPMALSFSPKKTVRMLSLVILALGYVVLLWAGRTSGMESVVMIPPGMCLLFIAIRPWGRKALVVLAAVLLIMSIALGLLLRANAVNFGKAHISVAYRLENVMFSWHIAKQHPVLGIGLWSPRDAYLKDYEISYPHLTKEMFSKWTHDLRTSENSLLTFMTDLGFPFLLLYLAAFLMILWRFLTVSLSEGRFGIPPPALLLPVMGAFMHLQVYEGFFQPQVNWFFCLLWGLAPAATPVGAGQWRGFAGRLAVMCLAMASGAAIGWLAGG